MKRTRLPIPKKIDSDPIRKRIEANVKAYNKPLTLMVGSMTREELLACCHPSDREDFEKELGMKKY